MLALSVFNDTSAQVRKRIIHHRIENKIDRREDVRDRREDVLDRRTARMHQRAFVERRPHQVTPIDSAARTPEASPSSWKPFP